MKHIRLFLLTIWCLVSMTAFAYADPISATIVGAIGLTGISAAVATTALDLAFAAGLSYVEQAIVGKQKTNTTGNSGKLSTGGTVGRTFMVGVGQTAGSLAYVGTWGSANKTKNAYCTFVIPLSDLPVTSLEELWVDNVKVTLPDMSGTAPYDQGWAVSEYNKPSGNNHLWIRFYNGTQTTADSFLVDTFGGSTDRPWKDTAVGTGISYAIITCQADSSLFSGFPQFNFALKGIPVYSIRKDSTNGGSGSHRWNDPSTWEWSGNAADITYTVLRGLSYGGKWFYGMQSLSANRQPYAEWSAAAAKCDVIITNADASTEAQYRCGGEIPVGTQLSDTITDFLTACNGRLAEAGGIYKLRVGSAGSSVASITDGDILSTEDQTFSPIISLSDKINGLTAKYPEPNQMWAQYDAPPLYNSTYEAQDGNRRLLTDITYNLVPYQRQVQRLMASALAEHRRARQHTLMLPPWAYILEPGDVIDWTSTRNGYDVKLFRVDQVADQPNCDIQVQITEVDPTDYDWNAATDEKPVSYGTLTINVPPPQVMEGWSASGATVNDPDGTARRPAIQLFYEGDLTGVAYVQAQVRYPGTTDLLFTDQTPYGYPNTNAASESVLISFASILPNVEYEVRGRFVPTSSYVSSLWSNETEDAGVITEGAWLAVTTPNAQFTTDDIANDAITSNKILAGAVTELQLADQAVGTAKLQVAAVTADVLADQAVLGSKLADAAVSSSKLEDDAVIASKIAAGAVNSTKFAAGITPVEIGSSLPTTGNFAGRTFFDTSGGKTYTYTNGEWTTPIFDIGPGTITGDMIANAAITASKLLDGAVTSTKIQAGAVGAGQIAANSITASKLVLTDFTNLVPDNQMVDQGSWSPGAGWSFGGVSTIGGKNYYRYVAQGNSAYGQPLNSLQFPIDATKTYFFSINYTPQSSGTVQFLFRLSWRDIGNNELSTSDIAVGPTSAVGTLSGQATPPANAQFAYAQVFAYDPGTTASLAVALPVVRVMANAELIVDGSITTSKLLAGSVTSDILAANSVVAGKIAAGAVSATQLAAGSITADKLTVGKATNWIENSDFSAGLARWTWGGSSPNTSVTLRNDGQFNVPGHPCMCVYEGTAGDDTGHYTDVWPLHADGGVGFACVPGQRYELSAYINTHRCQSGLYANFFDAAGNFISTLGYTLYPETDASGGTMAMFARRTIFVTAPANAATIQPFVRKVGTSAGYADSYMFLYRCQLADATSNQTEPSPWSPAGITLVTSDVIKTGAVIADSISGGAITAEKLSVGTSGNMIMNSDFLAQSYPGVSVGYDGTAGLPDSNGLGFSPYYPSGMASFYFSYAATPPVGPGGYAQIVRVNSNDGGSAYWPVVGGQKYEFSVYMSIHRCNAQARIIFFDAAGNVVGDSLGNVCPEQIVGNTSLGAWSRSGVLVTAPATASKCFCRVQMIGTGGTNPYVFFTGLYLAQANPNQTQLSPWAPAGSTAIDGDQVITNSLYASKIVAASITSDKMAASSVTASAIAAGSVTSAAIAAGAVTADKITVGSLAALSGTLGAVDISQAVIGTLQVGSANIADASISSPKTHDLQIEFLEAA